MFTITWRVTKRQVAAAAAVLVLAFAGGVWLRSALSETDGKAAQAPAPSEIKVEKAAGKTNEQRITFLESFGWQVEPEEEEILEVKIPKELDEVYEKYGIIEGSRAFIGHGMAMYPNDDYLDDSPKPFFSRIQQ